jgi:hypothetical protein
MEKGRLHVLIGLPRSGKSTYANKWIREIVPRPRAIVSGDDIRQALTGERYNSHSEIYVQAIKKTSIEAQLLRGHDVIVDGTHTTWNSLRVLLKIDPEAEFIFYPPEIVDGFDTSSDVFWAHVDECRARAISSGQSDLLPVISRMIDNLIHLINGFEINIEAERERAREYYECITTV